ncbi:putative niacin/nicotinamide transporter NaiP [Clostridium ljungdahlii DSM 13528]|uniref:Niacin/nicotinamide transporter NaiP n=1 Tax=Clostridium ljungdahlii (strain ATCC 55383 / DSM 13528 / PETC) TaxID=748727 RepID=D8GJL3_CLOLD|nr:MFS transporter [Clostridium ljungdahlii]ADK15174.1 predicted transporter protein [Clostridium ljungdahlii DSM 13528]OAA88654.1 putative niacin/nicotinamide transporter NaiP [Clostridium ljungdahlii DSM 13528]
MSSISRRIEKLPATHMLWTVLFLSGIGWLFDAMDQGMMAGVMASIGKSWRLTPADLGLLGSASAVGMAIGAAVAGMVADKYGRRTVVTFTLVLYGLASAVSGISPNFSILLLLRFLTGLGLGGELPAASTLVSEFSPAKSRGRMVVLLESFWAWGWIASALIAYLLIPVYGWRIGFFLGGIPALYAAYLRRNIPESPRYLEQKGRLKEADGIVRKMEQQAGIINNEIAVTDLSKNKKMNSITLADLWSKAYFRRTIVLWVLWLGINFGYYGFVLWTPTLLVGKGFSLVKGFQFTLIMSIAQLPGYYSAAYLIEKIGRKVVLVVYLIGTSLSAYLFGQATSAVTVLVFGCLLYFFSLGAWGAVYAYTPEVYPTRVRGSGAGWAAAIGRIGAIAAPYIVGLVYETKGKQAGFTYVFLMLTIVFAVVALVVALVGIETKGRSLDEINVS